MKNLCKHFSGGGNFKHPVTSFTKGTALSLLLAACTTFTACNSDESSLPTAGNQLQLSFGINAPQSRAIFTGTKLPDNSPVGVRLDGYADYANLVFTGSTTSGTQSWASTTSVTLTDTKGTLYAYWPQSSSVAIDAIDVDMTAADQTDWLYATPVTDVNEDKASVAVTMNHALANINVKVNKGSYLGAGNITNITVQSDGIALGGTFNAAQTTPGYTAFEDEGKPLSRTVTTTAGAAATDIMVVPTGTSAPVTFLLTIDGIQFTATSAAVQLAMGNSYQYTLNLSDISTYMEISGFSVKAWTSTTGGTLDLDEFIDKTPHVYAVAADGSLIDYNSADATATGLALVAGKHKFMIAKSDATDGTYTKFYWSYNLNGKDVAGIVNYNNLVGTNESGYLPKPDDSYVGDPKISRDFTTWTDGPLSDFNGKANTAAIIAGYTEHSVAMKTKDMCTVLNTFNTSNSHNDWYIPAFGQLALMYLNRDEINAALTKIGGSEFVTEDYWSSTEGSNDWVWSVHFYGGLLFKYLKNFDIRVRFIRDI